ncbi:Hypothetical protein, putative [Bodo saltans]|uniref:Uncharacterized protein n=1 Tax=Bodo saltans TaxID=75058 RepID=A0A0S4JAL2_BODSA|nr:Hypothetical protein, putative [Bodo saltans]|eukprot:CUG87164.1 Hypothetical protein, putative [Bodo saltans]
MRKKKKKRRLAGPVRAWILFSTAGKGTNESECRVTLTPNLFGTRSLRNVSMSTHRNAKRKMREVQNKAMLELKF